MTEHQIIFDELLQKPEGSGAIGQRMIDLKIHPLLIIIHLKQQIFPVPDIKIHTGRVFLRRHDCRKITVFQIVPEQSLTHHRPVHRIFFQGPVQSRLQNTAVNILF